MSRPGAVPAVVLLTRRGAPADDVARDLLIALRHRTGAEAVRWVAGDDSPLPSLEVPTAAPAEGRHHAADEPDALPGGIDLRAPVVADGRVRGALLLRVADGRGATGEDARGLAETADCLAVLLRREVLTADAARWWAAASAARFEHDAGMGRLAAAEFAERRRLAATVTALTDPPLADVVAGLEDAVAAPPGPARPAALDRAARAASELAGRLRELARGVHPVALREQGASRALADVADSLGLGLTVVKASRRGGWEVETGLFWAVAAALQVVARWPRPEALVARWSVAGTRHTCDLEVLCADPVGPVTLGEVHSALEEHSGRLEALGGGWSVTSDGCTVTVTCHLPQDLRVQLR